MTTLNRRTFLRGLVYGLLGTVLGWEIEAIATEATLPAEEQTPCDSCIGWVCSMCNNYEWYKYAGPAHWRYAAPREVEPPCDSCIGLACFTCSNYEWYLYADPEREAPGLDAVRRAGHMYSWEGTAELPKQFQDANAKFNKERREIAEWAKHIEWIGVSEKGERNEQA